MRGVADWLSQQSLTDRSSRSVSPVYHHPAHILFDSHKSASEGITKLHAHTYKSQILSAVLKKRLDASLSKSTSGKDHSNRAGRLIIRNLAWNTTESDLRLLFVKFGPILGINLPTAPTKKVTVEGEKPAPPRARGFAFVWFLAKADAEKAIEEVNGKELKERVMAVDWALSKDKWEENKDAGGVVAGQGEEGVKVEGEGKADDGVEEVPVEKDDEDEDGDIEMADGEIAVEAEQAEEEEQEEKPVKPTLPTVEEGSTLFVRNLPFEVTEEELRNL